MDMVTVRPSAAVARFSVELAWLLAGLFVAAALWTLVEVRPFLIGLVIAFVFAVVGHRYLRAAVALGRFRSSRQPLLVMDGEGIRTVELPGSLRRVSRSSVESIIQAKVSGSRVVSFVASTDVPSGDLPRGWYDRGLRRANLIRGLGDVTICDVQCADDFDGVVRAIRSAWPDVPVVEKADEVPTPARVYVALLLGV